MRGFRSYVNAKPELNLDRKIGIIGLVRFNQDGMYRVVYYPWPRAVHSASSLATGDSGAASGLAHAR